MFYLFKIKLWRRDCVGFFFNGGKFKSVCPLTCLGKWQTVVDWVNSSSDWALKFSWRRWRRGGEKRVHRSAYRGLRLCVPQRQLGEHARCAATLSLLRARCSSTYHYDDSTRVSGTPSRADYGCLLSAATESERERENERLSYRKRYTVMSPKWRRTWRRVCHYRHIPCAIYRTAFEA